MADTAAAVHLILYNLFYSFWSSADTFIHVIHGMGGQKWLPGTSTIKKNTNDVFKSGVYCKMLKECYACPTWRICISWLLYPLHGHH